MTGTHTSTASRDEPGSPEYLRKVGLAAAQLRYDDALQRLQKFHDEPLPTIGEAFSWRDQLATADDTGQRLQGELHAARQAAQDLLTKERLHSGSGRDGHLNREDLVPLFAALRIEMWP